MLEGPLGSSAPARVTLHVYQNHRVGFIKIQIPRPLPRSFDAEGLQKAPVLCIFNKQSGGSKAVAQNDHSRMHTSSNPLILQIGRLRPRKSRDAQVS